MKLPLLLSLFALTCACSDKWGIRSDLTFEEISATPDRDLETLVLDDISEQMSDDGRSDHDFVMSLTPGQQAVYVTYIVDGEVFNGGFNQFYFNSSGEFADMSEQAYRTLGANRYADLVHRANVLYDSIKDDLGKYDDGTIESFSESNKDNPLNLLDDEFYQIDTIEVLSRLRIKYIREHVNEFAKP